MRKEKIVIKVSQSLWQACMRLIDKFRKDTIKVGGYEKHILDCFPPRKDRESDISEFSVTILGFTRSMESLEIINAIMSKDLFPLPFDRFFVLGRERFGLQEQNPILKSPIITFDRIWQRRGELYVPCFWGNFKDFPDIWYFNEVWPETCCFALSEN